MKLFRTIEVAADDGYKVGDVISFTLNDGKKVEALAVKQEDDGMIFYFVDALVEMYHMNYAASNHGGYQSSELRKNLNDTILECFPTEICEKMIAFENGDFLRLATEREIFGECIYSEYGDDSIQQWEPMKDRRNRLCFQGYKSGWLVSYWLQDESRDNNINFSSVDYDGYGIDSQADDALGVRPVFKMR